MLEKGCPVDRNIKTSGEVETEEHCRSGGREREQGKSRRKNPSSVRRPRYPVSHKTKCRPVALRHTLSACFALVRHFGVDYILLTKICPVFFPDSLMDAKIL